MLGLSRDPQSFRQQVEARPRGSWVVVDEVQRLPSLLNEVHALVAERPGVHRFALSGSSARKLKRLDVNLLAGRAVNRQFFPLTAAEIGKDFNLERALRYGVLPQVQTEPSDAVDVLDAYVTNYIREEVMQEAMVRNLESFARFLEVAALMNGQVLNVAGVARDAAVARPTVQGYFATLVDTLIGFWLPAWRKRAKVKEVASPKFYLFDPGVARALAGRTARARGGQRAGVPARDAGAARTPGGHRVPERGRPTALLADAIGNRSRLHLDPRHARGWHRGEGLRRVEVRARRGPQRLLADGQLTRGHGVYTGTAELKDGPLRVWPARQFFARLTAGEILG